MTIFKELQFILGKSSLMAIPLIIITIFITTRIAVVILVIKTVFTG